MPSSCCGRSDKLMLAAAVLLACALASLPSADAHAALQTPASRNGAFFTSRGEGWLDAYGNGLGPRPFRPAGNPGVCGDPYQDASIITNLANFAGPVTTYTSGQNIRVNVRLQVNHGGRITFRLCDRKTNLDQACFNGRTLNRADTGRPHYYILTGSWANTNAGNPEYVGIDYKLPDGFSCPNGCVLQMEYFTYNTCVEQCPRSDCSWYADRMNYIIPAGQQGPKAICYTAGAGTPEIFRNCADIVITGGSGTGTGGGGVCDKCNLPAYLGGCKCDGACNCLPGTGGAVCDKCNIPVASGGCKCDGNCACTTTGTSCSSTTTPGGSCGNGVCCPSGQCCSQYGWCGTTSAHCGAGCQSRFGACSAASASLTGPRSGRKSRFGVYDASNTTLVQTEAGAGITADVPVAVTSTIDPAAAATSVEAAAAAPTTPVDPTATAGPASVDPSTAAAAPAATAPAPADVAAAAVGVVDPAVAVASVDPAVAAPAPDAAVVAAAAPEAGK